MMKDTEFLHEQIVFYERCVDMYYFRLFFVRSFVVPSIHSFDFPSFFLLFFNSDFNYTTIVNGYVYMYHIFIYIERETHTENRK